jgi:hypothetical protein
MDSSVCLKPVGIIILELILKKSPTNLWTGVYWLGTGRNSGVIWRANGIYRFMNMCSFLTRLLNLAFAMWKLLQLQSSTETHIVII